MLQDHADSRLQLCPALPPQDPRFALTSPALVVGVGQVGLVDAEKYSTVGLIQPMGQPLPTPALESLLFSL